VQHYPPLPPQHPAFRPLIASIPRFIEQHGARGAARRLREKQQAIREQATAKALSKPGAPDAFDIRELDNWLEWRIHELEGANVIDLSDAFAREQRFNSETPL
jgi:hypothetical protein